MKIGKGFGVGLGLFLASVIAFSGFSGCKKKEFVSGIRKKTDMEVANTIDRDIGASRAWADFYGQGHGGDYEEAKMRDTGTYNDYNGEVEYLCKNAGWHLYFLEYYREAGDSKRIKAYGDTTKGFLEEALKFIESDTSTWRYDYSGKGDCKPAIGVVNDYLGQVHSNLGEDKLALECFEESQKFNDSIGYKVGVVETIIHRGELFRERKQHRESLRELETASEICKSMIEIEKKKRKEERGYDSWKKWLARCYEERSRTYRKMGDSENSLKYSRTAQELRESADDVGVNIKFSN